MRIASLLLLTLSLLTASLPAAEPPTVRVMSFNIRYGTAKDGDNHWDARREFLVETIRKFDPDLLGTQETLGFQRDYLAQQLTDYTGIGIGRDDGQEKGEMVAVFFRTERFELVDQGHFWLSPTPSVPGSKGWDAAITRMVTWLKLKDKQDDKRPPVYFFNTHFDHIGKQARIQSAELLRDRLDNVPEEALFVVTGDFNAGEGSRPHRTLFADHRRSPHRVLDTFREVHKQRRPEEGTFSNFSAAGRAGERIDWIGCSDQWTVLKADIDHTAREGRTPSDHFPVTAVLGFPEAKSEKEKPRR